MTSPVGHYPLTPVIFAAMRLDMPFSVRLARYPRQEEIVIYAITAGETSFVYVGAETLQSSASSPRKRKR